MAVSYLIFRKTGNPFGSLEPDGGPLFGGNPGIQPDLGGGRGRFHKTPEQAGQNAYDVTQKWVEQNPDLVNNYAAWAKELGAV